MMCAQAQEPLLRGTLLTDEPMAAHTTWRVGGPARRYYRPADVDDLALYLARLDEDEPLYWVGLGSNLLVRDGGWKGTVIATAGLLDGVQVLTANRVRAEAGVSCAKVARFCARAGLEGVEFLSGIPGTMGGALAMNAGCFGGETWNRVVQVETLDRYGVRRTREASDYQVGYRRVSGPQGEWFVAAYLQLQPADPAALAQRARELLQRRGDSQPTRLPNAGSVFRNPPGDHAARLIDQCGLKGRCVGGACVSDKHANFIVNTGAASASDIETLMAEVAARVEAEFGVRLEPEVKVIGESLEAAHG